MLFYFHAIIFSMTDKWIKDTGIVSAFIFLILGFRYGKEFFVVSGILLLLAILVPKVFYPVAFPWLKFIEILNLVMPKIFFGAVFFIVIFPIGRLKRLVSGDTLMVNNWKQIDSVFRDRKHIYTKLDIQTPY